MSNKEHLHFFQFSFCFAAVLTLAWQGGVSELPRLIEMAGLACLGGLPGMTVLAVQVWLLGLGVLTRLAGEADLIEQAVRGKRYGSLRISGYLGDLRKSNAKVYLPVWLRVSYLFVALP